MRIMTTIKQPIKEICIDAVDKLIKLINGEEIKNKERKFKEDNLSCMTS